MNAIIDQIVSFLKQGITAIFSFFELIWNWSFGQMFAIFQSDWQSLPIWKIAVLAVVVIAIVYVLYKAIIQLWKAAEQILKAFIGLLSVLVTILPFILIAGLIAAAGSWVIPEHQLLGASGSAGTGGGHSGGRRGNRARLHSVVSRLIATGVPL